MREWTVKSGEKDQRFSKYLQRRLPGAPSSFLYKMLRKKNITLNGKKASGSELLLEGDLVTLFLSDETIVKFGGDIGKTAEESGKSADGGGEDPELTEYVRSYRQLRGRIGKDGILYEDKDILAVRKPVGILSQKAAGSDRTMNEWLLGYLLDKREVDAGSLRHFKPSVCNRLDRNTGGIIICSKSLTGARKIAELLRSRSMHKYYQAVVLGTVRKSGKIEGYLQKDAVTNTVNFTGSVKEGGTWTKTTYSPLISGAKYSLLEMELITGKTHQLRSHLAAMGHPILGDPKYGDLPVNEKIRGKYGLRGQMLWCCRIEFPRMGGELPELSGRVITCDPPRIYREIADAH